MVRTALAVNGTVVLETELEPQHLHIQCNLSCASERNGSNEGSPVWVVGALGMVLTVGVMLAVTWILGLETVISEEVAPLDMLSEDILHVFVAKVVLGLIV